MFLVATLSSMGTRWMTQVFNEMGIQTSHDTYPSVGGFHGIVGSEKWMFRMNEFSPVVLQIRHPLSWMETKIRNTKGDVSWVNKDNMAPFGYDNIEVVDEDAAKMKALMCWYRAMHFAVHQPEVLHIYRVEDMWSLGEEFRFLVRMLGFNPDSLNMPSENRWANVDRWKSAPGHGMSHAKNLVPGGDREIPKKWPSVKSEAMSRNLKKVQDLALLLGYEI